MQIVNPNKNNLVVCHSGLKGSGKTLVMALLLYYEYKILHKKIYANFDLSFPHNKLNIDEMIKLDVKLQNAVIGLTELHMICDSRKHNKKQNIQMSYFVLQSRHRSVNFYYDTQQNSQVDVRIRNNTDINIVCENLYIDSDSDNQNDLFRIIIQDKRRMAINYISKIIYGTPIFDLYNTNTIINPFTMKEMQKPKGD